MIVVWRRCITKPYKYKSITMLSNHDVREEFYAFVHQNSFDPDDNDIKSILEGDDLEKLTEEAMMEAL